MIEVIATSVPGQGHASLIRTLSLPREPLPEWQHYPPSTVPLVIRTPVEWSPTGTENIPGTPTFAMPKREAAVLAISLNRRRMALEKTRDKTQRDTVWALVVLHKKGFAVVQVNVLDFHPSDPFELPPDAWPLTTANVVARCALKEFNQRQMDAAGSPRYWCLAVKRLTLADLMTDEELAEEGGAR
ncbi:hypothetical protein VT03_01905 [Planctomyces sp. SH-PL14]|nr:hypothetical protein VT03_01905 [Planctomyces sp. SH-PL14]